MILEKQFKGKFKISFEPFLQKKECLINATEMANAFDKRVPDYLKSEKTQAFILVLENELGNKNHEHKNAPQDDARRLGDENYVCDVDGEKIIISDNILKVKHGGGCNGTWLHRHLAIDFAMWLDPYFKFWMISCIDEILFGFGKVQQNCIEEKLKLNNEKDNILDNSPLSLEDYKRLFEIGEALKEITKEKNKSTTSQKRQLELLLFGNEQQTTA